MMNNVRDNRNHSDWPARVEGVSKNTVTVNMNGGNGYNDVTNGHDGQGVVTDNNGVSYPVRLPGLRAAGNYIVTFDRIL